MSRRETQGNAAYEWWRREYPIPATPEQLQNLAALHGLKLIRIDGMHSAASSCCWRMTQSDPEPLESETVMDFYADSPIERYITRIAEWRRERI